MDLVIKRPDGQIQTIMNIDWVMIYEHKRHVVVRTKNGELDQVSTPTGSKIILDDCNFVL